VVEHERRDQIEHEGTAEDHRHVRALRRVLMIDSARLHPRLAEQRPVPDSAHYEACDRGDQDHQPVKMRHASLPLFA
jgi:hypothetical protein